MSRIALVHDNFAQMGRAERVAGALYRLLPEAHLYSTLAVRERLSEDLSQAEIRTTWMQYLPSSHQYYRHYFLLYPFAVERMDLSAYDLIVTSCHGYAKGIRKPAGAVHVCYCHSPMRWIWQYKDYIAREQFGDLKQMVLPKLLVGLKRWDLRAAQRPDYFVVNSQVVAQRIKNVYRRDSVVIPPPVNLNRFRPSYYQQDYYLVLSRLAAYKRIDLAIEACNRLKRSLVVIGDGPDRKRLESLAGPTVAILGRQPEGVVESMVSRCRALLFPGEEDFSTVPLEVNAGGRPVIAYRSGGVPETVVEGETGILFEQATSESVAEAILKFETYTWNQRKLRRHAEKFSDQVFATRFLEFLNSVAPGVLPQNGNDEISAPPLRSLVAKAS